MIRLGKYSRLLLFTLAFFTFFLSEEDCVAQKKKQRINILNAESLEYDDALGKDVQRLVGDVKFENRCPLDQSGPRALAQPGDLYRMFERIVTDPQFAKYEPKVLSRPTNATVDDAPWFLVLENVVSPEECETLIALGAARGYKPSSEVGHAVRYDLPASIVRGSYLVQLSQEGNSTSNLLIVR